MVKDHFFVHFVLTQLTVGGDDQTFWLWYMMKLSASPITDLLANNGRRLIYFSTMMV
ncbi:MAG: hypothetical protein ACJA1J_001151 [Sulfitobacter pontiacus]|jgi:hypothetical protein|tara:strand:+ start:167 stop:337 length:171 start_codon:yes stop_codon:yes gene_type:complete